ncbi:LacI family transcriptional regulator [Opitutaceae bacterium TAV4]|nr:LacI family transcriptional regulator [Opitutaceae bacterium TAV4]RRK01840.1 LacI family transcriptional regulator [Opitutaceae bacterium TAV3]
MKPTQSPRKGKGQGSQKSGRLERKDGDTGPVEPSIKIEEVARIAKVSMATVSRVFNHHPSIRPELRRHVLAVAREHGYFPRLSLKQKNVVIITPYHPVWPVHSCVDMILMALTQEMPRRGFRLEILPSDNCDRLDDIQFCAAVAIGAEPSEFAGWSDRFPVPLVILDREGEADPPHVFCIRSDENQGMELAIEHLHERGCRKIGCIIHGEPGTGNTDQRHAAVVQALKSRKLPCDDSLILFSGAGSEKYVELIGKLLKRGVDALFCPGGNAGIIALYAFSLYDRRVPDDISLIASEQTLFSQYTVPPLTTLSPDYQAMAAATADVIEARLEGRDTPGRTVLPYGLIKRESVAPRR